MDSRLAMHLARAFGPQPRSHEHELVKHEASKVDLAIKRPRYVWTKARDRRMASRLSIGWAGTFTVIGRLGLVPTRAMLATTRLHDAIAVAFQVTLRTR